MKIYKITNKEWEVPAFSFDEFSNKKSKYCVCIPVINEGERIKKELGKMRSIARSADIIIADLGSTDGSLNHEFLKKSGVRTLLVKNGPGRLSAQLRMALAYAMQENYAGVIFIDGNNKDDPSTIPDFIKKLDEGFDYVQGSRFIKGGKSVNTPFIRSFIIRFIHSPLLSLFAGKRYTDTTNGYRAFSRKMIVDKRINLFRNIFVTYELLFYSTLRATQLGYKTIEIPVTRAYPKSGKTPTKISPIKGYLNNMWSSLKCCFGFYNP